MSDVNPVGRFVWYDLMTTDPEAAVAFYSRVVGWGTSIWEGGGTPYTMWTNGEVPMGGVSMLPDEAAAAGAPPHWLAYIATPDIDQTLQLATAKGGKVLHPAQEVPEVGRFAVLSDPQGAVLAVYTSSSQAPPPEAAPKPGEFSWHELATTDHEAAFDFYSSLFGWEKTEAMDMGPMGIYQMYGRGEFTLGGMFNKTPEMPGPPHWLLYAMVDDVHQRVETVKSAGGQVLNGPMEVPGGDWIAQCLDPQGAAFAIHSKVAETKG